jgi:hypothetical protein
MFPTILWKIKHWKMPQGSRFVQLSVENDVEMSVEVQEKITGAC